MGVVCRSHPNETSQPGICPSCLRERLTRLIAVNHSKLTYNIYSSSPSLSASPVYLYGYSSASSSPPPQRRRLHQRVASDIMDSIYLARSGINISGLKKSRSMANYHPPRNHDDDAVNHKKKGGFWKKKLLLIHSNAKKAKFW